MPNIPTNMGSIGQMGGIPNIPMGNINPAAIANISQMLKKGADIKSIVATFKQSGMSPQLMEQLLFMVFPQLKGLKQQMDMMQQSGMNQQDMFAEFAKRANTDPSKINDMYNDLMRLVK